MNKSKIGVLLVNLGTPVSNDIKAVRRYLKEFLDDPRVIDLPWIIRKILLHLFILPFRSKLTTLAYSTIWDKAKGSPLLFHTLDLAKSAGLVLGEEYHVEVGMRYGQPSISSSVNKLLGSGCEKLLVLPLFPQYSSAATGSAIESVLRTLQFEWNIPSLTLIRDFFDHRGYLEAQSKLIEPFLADHQPDAVIFSFHSLPVRHIRKSNAACEVLCFQAKPCPSTQSQPGKRACYRAQCYQTTRLLAANLGLREEHYQVAFQSRLGKTPWIGPDLQTVMQTLINNNQRKLLVVCPSFVADCLETLEEVGIRAKALWFSLGGEQFTLVPCLNASPLWVERVADMIRAEVC